MLVSTRSRIISATLIAVALVFTGISLFTCHWTDFIVAGFTYSNGLFSQEGCRSIFGVIGGTPAWNTAVFGLMIGAFACEVVLIIFIAATSFIPRHHGNKHLISADLFLIMITFLALLASLVTYGIASTGYWNDNIPPSSYFDHNLSYSFYLAIPAAVFAIIALGPVTHALHIIHRGGGDYEWNF